MKSALALATAIFCLAAANPAAATLAAGDPAPSFTTRGVLGSTAMTVDLALLLRQGPAVIFFFPSAFSETAECREFAENIDKFRAAGASVVGMSRDSVESLTRFSIEQCAGKIPVASADQALVDAFDVNDGAMFNTRTTYVIATSGKIAFVHDSEDSSGHVKSALAFVQAMTNVQGMTK